MDESQEKDIDDLFSFDEKGNVLLKRSFNFEHEFKFYLFLIDLSSFALAFEMSQSRPYSVFDQFEPRSAI